MCVAQLNGGRIILVINLVMSEFVRQELGMSKSCHGIPFVVNFTFVYLHHIFVLHFWYAHCVA